MKDNVEGDEDVDEDEEGTQSSSDDQTVNDGDDDDDDEDVDDDDFRNMAVQSDNLLHLELPDAPNLLYLKAATICASSSSSFSSSSACATGTVAMRVADGPLSPFTDGQIATPDYALKSGTAAITSVGASVHESGSCSAMLSASDVIISTGSDTTAPSPVLVPPISAFSGRLLAHAISADRQVIKEAARSVLPLFYLIYSTPSDLMHLCDHGLYLMCPCYRLEGQPTVDADDTSDSSRVVTSDPDGDV